MSDYLAADGTFINSIVGEGTRFRGELDLDGLLRIDGDYKGSIKTTGKVLVGRNGRAECTIKAGTVVIGGVVKGNIVSTEKVIILSSGILIGNVSSPRLIIEEGVILDGACLINQNEFDPNIEFDGNGRLAFGKTEDGPNVFQPQPRDEAVQAAVPGTGTPGPEEGEAESAAREKEGISPGVTPTYRDSQTAPSGEDADVRQEGSRFDTTKEYTVWKG